LTPSSAGLRADSAEEGAVALSEHERIAALSAVAAEPALRRLKNVENAVERPIVVSL
jgi:hypothetical protein